MKRGTRIRMTLDLKVRMRGKCGLAGRHLGPFENDDVAPRGDKGSCYGCSSEHVDEFGECVGYVEDLVDYNNVPPNHPDYDSNKIGPEVNVRWLPSRLRYAYKAHDLEPA